MKGVSSHHVRGHVRAARDKNAAEIDEVIERFIAHCARRGMLKSANELMPFLERIVREEEGIIRIEAVIAPGADKKHVLDILEDAFGKKTEITIIEDASIIGGMRLRINDQLIDATIATQLANLKRKLTD